MNEIRYPEAAGQHLAYKVLDGADGHELVVITPGGTIPMQMLESDRIGARLIRGLQTIGRLVLFDRRGIGRSDPIADWTRPLVEQWYRAHSGLSSQSQAQAGHLSQLR